MRQLAPEYRGYATWHFYELSNGGMYMAPRLESSQIRVTNNAYDGNMSTDAAGITACLKAFAYVSFQVTEEKIAEHYDLLLEFASQHREATKILAAIH